MGNKETLLLELKTTFEEVSRTINAIDDSQIRYKPIENQWSIGEEFDHMIKSLRPVAKGLAMPKLSFLVFGRSNNSSRSHDEMQALYLAKLAEGPVNLSNSSFAPSEPKASDFMKQRWQESGEMLIKNLSAYWKEKSLDKNRMPHPLLGKLSVREMLYFTDFHSRHHLTNIQQKIENLLA